MQPLPDIRGCIHLSVEAGCGGTTFALQKAREILSDNRHVIWICNEMPDGERMSQIFADTPPKSVSKLHVAVVGENLVQGINSAIGLMMELESLGLIVVDDWAPKSGSVPAESVSALNKLIEISEKRDVPLLLISAAYEDASGHGGWKARGKLKVTTWFLHISGEGLSIRNLNCGDITTQLTLKDQGFILRK